MILYSIPVYKCPDCVKQLCDGILFFDKNALIVLHVSKSENIENFKMKHKQILINNQQFETKWGWDFTRVHVSNYKFVKDKYDIEYVIFVPSNSLMIKEPNNYIKNYDAGFSEQQHGFFKLTPPLLKEDYQIGWGGSFLKSDIYLNILSELNTNDKYGCIIDCTYVNSIIMNEICYFYEKYFNYDKITFYLEEILIPTISCNLTKKISDSLLYMKDLNLEQLKKILIDNNDKDFPCGPHFFTKRVEMNMNNDNRIYYENFIKKHE